MFHMALYTIAGMSHKHAHSNIIDGLGPSLLRNQFRLSYGRLANWRVRGIPHTHRAAVAQIAALHGVGVPPDFLAPPMEP
jgi:hypothetical protein